MVRLVDVPRLSVELDAKCLSENGFPPGCQVPQRLNHKATVLERLVLPGAKQPNNVNLCVP